MNTPGVSTVFSILSVAPGATGPYFRASIFMACVSSPCEVVPLFRTLIVTRSPSHASMVGPGIRPLYVQAAKVIPIPKSTPVVSITSRSNVFSRGPAQAFCWPATPGMFMVERGPPEIVAGPPAAGDGACVVDGAGPAQAYKATGRVKRAKLTASRALIMDRSSRRVRTRPPAGVAVFSHECKSGPTVGARDPGQLSAVVRNEPAVIVSR